MAVIVTRQECVVVFQKYKEFERAVRVEEIDGLRLVKRLAEDMEEMFHKKAQAMKVLQRNMYLSHWTKLGLEISQENCNGLKYTTTCYNFPNVFFCLVLGVNIWPTPNHSVW